MMNLRFSPLSLAVALMAASWLALPAFAEEGESMSIVPETPDWFEGADVLGRFVHVFGSESKFREDHNMQSGVDIGASAFDESEDGRIISFDGMFQPVDQQGYGRFNYDKLGAYSFDSQFQGWSEFYNTRPGVDDQTVLGTRLDPSGAYPNTTDGRPTYGGGKPSVDWLTLKAGVAKELPGPFNDVYADFMYRTQKGEMSLVKGGTITDPLAVPTTVPGSGPGTVFFDYPGRKDVNYETVGCLAGVRSSLGGIAWRFDGSAYHHDIKSRVREPNFGSSASLGEFESFREDTDIVTANANLVGSRQLTPELFIYGGGVFAFAESEPNPSQVVQGNFPPGAVPGLITRVTRGDGEVTRYNESLNAGLVYQPVSSVVMSADLGFRASQQDGNLNELRDESALLTGDTGSVANDSNRDNLSFFAKGDVTWKAARRLSFKGQASYKHSSDDVDSKRVFGFVVAEPNEIEDYDVNRERVTAGASGRYRFKGGRRLDVGYDFLYEGSDTDADQLNNQFLVGDYKRTQHNVLIKFSGRITRKLRGEVRGRYTFEKRDMDAPIVDALILGSAGQGNVEFQGISLSPTLSYQHSATLSGYLNVTVGQQQWDLENAGVAPAGFNGRFAGFEYDTITETATIGMNWAPADRLKTSASYTIYNNHESVENMGHNAVIRSAYALDENWNLNSGVRYLGYQPDNNNLDDYSTIIVTLGFSGRF